MLGRKEGKEEIRKGGRGGGREREGGKERKRKK